MDVLSEAYRPPFGLALVGAVADDLGGDQQIESDVGLRQVVARWQAGFEQQPGTC